MSERESEYYLRFISMYIDLCTECVYNVFLHYNPNTNNNNFFQANHKRFYELEKQKILTKTEVRFLISQVPRVDKFDISLLLKLLSNVITSLQPPKKGWEFPPDPFDFSIAADLLRLRKIRNDIIAHQPRAKLPKYKFDRFWEVVYQILVRITRAISPCEEATVLERLDFYKKRPLDQQQQDCQRYLSKLEEWWQSCEEVSSLQIKFDDLLKKSEEFMQFFKTKHEDYCRYVRLLFDGGRCILLGIVQKETNLWEIINKKRNEIQERLVDEEMLRQIYPSETAPNVDFESWDILTLASVVVNFLQGSIDDDIIEDIKVITDEVTNYAQTALTSLDSNTFHSRSLDLATRITSLSCFVRGETQKQCKVYVENFIRKVDEPGFDVDEYLDKMKVHAHGIKTISDIYKETFSKIQTTAKQMDEEGIVFKTVIELHMKVITLGYDNEKKELAEEILFRVWKCALKKSQSPEEFESVRHEVDKLLEVLENIQDATPTTIERQCIILTLHCSSWSGLVSVLHVVNSDHFQECIENISRVLTDIVGEAITFKGKITMESLFKLMSNDDYSLAKKTDGLDFSIACSTIRSMQHMHALLDKEEIKRCFRDIGEALSKKVEASITVIASKDVSGLSRLFEEADGTTNYELGSDLASADSNVHIYQDVFESSGVIYTQGTLLVTKELHVSSGKSGVKKNMDIVLVCEVNLYTTNVTWRHNGCVITSSRHHISLNGKVHKLTILKAQYEDEGDYTVDFGTTKSSTTLKLTGIHSLEHRKRLTNDLYKHWIRGALGLKYLKLGLEDVSRFIVHRYHSKLLTKLSITGNICTQCTTYQLLPAHQQEQCPEKSKCICSKRPNERKLCPNGGFCSRFYDQVQNDHRFKDPLLANTDIQKWANDPWSVAKCFINTPGYHDKSSEKEIDCAGLLSLLINNLFFESIYGETDCLKTAMETRNYILHNANYELSEGQVNAYLDIFIGVLEAEYVNGKSFTEEAIDHLEKIHNDEIDVSIAGDFDKQELKEHGMTELADKAEIAEKQNHRKLQHIEKRMKAEEKEFKMVQDITKNSKDALELDLHLQVIDQNGEASAQGNRCIFQSMTDYHSGHGLNRKTSQTDDSLQRLLTCITHTGTEITQISQTETAVVIKIVFSSSNALQWSITLISGKVFQKELVQLQKCLENCEHLKIYDVMASYSSESLEHTRKCLFRMGAISSLTCEEHDEKCTWFCIIHDEFMCGVCRDSNHGTCYVQKLVSPETKKKERKLYLTHRIGKYNVRISNNSSDKDDCDVTSIRLLPNDEILLVDSKNSRLKKLDRTNTRVSHCDLPDYPWDVCYLGNDRAAVSLADDGIQFLNVSGTMKLEQQIKLDHTCHSLACHGETLYVGDINSLYSYDKHCTKKHILYRHHDYPIFVRHIAVSDDGEIIYIANDHKGLITIDKKGNHLFTLSSDDLTYSNDVCVVSDGSILVSDSLKVYQVDYTGKEILGIVVTASGGDYLKSVCFDRRNLTLLASRHNDNYISVFN